MKQDLDDYHRLVGYWRAKGYTEAEAHQRAEEAMMTPSEQNVGEEHKTLTGDDK